MSEEKEPTFVNGWLNQNIKSFERFFEALSRTAISCGMLGAAAYILASIVNHGNELKPELVTAIVAIPTGIIAFLAGYWLNKGSR